MHVRNVAVWRLLAGAVVTVAVAGAATGCSGGGDGEAGASSTGAEASSQAGSVVDGIAGPMEQYLGEGKVGFAIYNGTVPHWNRQDIPDLQQCLEQYAPNVDPLITADPKGDSQKQTSQVQAMISQGVNVLLLAPVVATPTAILNAAKQNDVTVINYANPLIDAEPGDAVALIGDGPEPVGTLFAQWVLDQGYPEGAKVALINGDLSTQYAQLIRKGALEGLQEATDSGVINLVADKGAKNYDPAEAEKLAAAVLVADPDVEAFMVGTAPMANAVISALKAIGREGQVDVIGLDVDPIAAQNILLGHQKAAVAKSAHDEMAVGCVAVIAALKGEPMPTDVFTDTWDLDTAPMPFKDVPLEIVDKDTLHVAIDKDILTKEEACEGLPQSVGGICAS